MFDTVALSESRKKAPNPGFMRWITGIEVDAIHTSVLCLGEIRRGVEKLPVGDRRTAFERWLEIELPAFLGQRVLTIDDTVAQAWGRMSAHRTLALPDALIGATALVYGLTVVTRNVRDFDGLGVSVVNPWT